MGDGGETYDGCAGRAGVAAVGPAGRSTAASVWPRAARTLALALVVGGLVVTGVRVALLAGRAGTPGWAILLTGYVALGVAATVGRGTDAAGSRRMLPLFLAVHALLMAVVLHAAPVPNDVMVYLRDGAGALLHLHNPYALTFPDIYGPMQSRFYFGPGVVVDGRIDFGFPYLPGSLLAVVGPSTALLLLNSWTEPTMMLALGVLVLALRRGHRPLAVLGIAALLTAKQYVVVVLPLFWLLRGRPGNRTMLTGGAAAAVVTLPFVAWDPPAFVRSVVELHLLQPFRPDSTSLLVAMVEAFGWRPPAVYGVLPLGAGLVTAALLAWRLPRTPSAFAVGVGLSLLVTVLLSKQAFINYYALVATALTVGAIAWPVGLPAGSASIATRADLDSEGRGSRPGAARIPT